MRTFALLLIMCLTLAISACKTQESINVDPTPEDIRYAQIECHDQAQDLTNRTIAFAQSASEPYFIMCMEQRFGFTLDEVNKMTF